MKDASSPSDAPEGFISHETYVGLMSLAFFCHQILYVFFKNTKNTVSSYKKNNVRFLQKCSEKNFLLCVGQCRVPHGHVPSLRTEVSIKR